MSLVEKYKELDIAMNKDNDKKVEEIFQDILKETFDIINKKIEKEENLLTSNEEELMAIRAMFEYMLELWSEGVIDEAKAVGYDMLYLVDDKKLKEMFSMFVIGMLEGLSVDKFFDKYIRTDKIYKDYFFCDFDDEIDELVIKHQAQFKKEFSE